MNRPRTISAFLCAIVAASLCGPVSCGKASTGNREIGLEILTQGEPASLREYGEFAQDLIRECMALNGYSVVAEEDQPTDDAPTPTEAGDDVATWGLGISTRFYAPNVVAAPAIGSPGGVGDVSSTEPVIEPEPGYFDAHDRCGAEAYSAADEEFPEVSRMSELMERFNSDSGVAELQRRFDTAVLGCLNKSGYSYESIDAVIGDYQSRVVDFNAGVAELYGETVTIPSGAETASESEFDQALMLSHMRYNGSSLTPRHNEDLAEIQQDERKLASSLWDCGYFPAHPTSNTEEIYDELVDWLNDSY